MTRLSSPSPKATSTQKPLSQASFQIAARERKREKLISEITDYLLAHNGPDAEGFAHPKQRLIRSESLDEAIGRARAHGLQGQWRPYHFRGHCGTYADLDVALEVLQKKGDQLLHKKFKGDKFLLATKSTREDWFSDFEDSIGKRKITVSTHAAARRCGYRIYDLLQHYGEVSGQAAYFKEFQEFHLSTTSHGAFSNPATINELLLRKGNYLRIHSFGGDDFRLATEATGDHWKLPFVDVVHGRQVVVRGITLAHVISNSPWQLGQRYLALRGETELKEALREYHSQNVPKDFYEKKDVIAELITLRGDSLAREHFNSDRKRMLYNATSNQWRESFIDLVCGKPVQVSMSMVSAKLPLASIQAIYSWQRGIPQKN